MCDTYSSTDIVDAGSVVYRAFGSQDIVVGAVLHKSLYLGCHFLWRSLVDDTLSLQSAQDDTVELTGGILGRVGLTSHDVRGVHYLSGIANKAVERVVWTFPVAASPLPYGSGGEHDKRLHRAPFRLGSA